MLKVFMTDFYDEFITKSEVIFSRYIDSSLSDLSFSMLKKKIKIRKEISI